MIQQPVWQWNELQQVGTDYENVAEVERYEQRMGEFRDLAAEDAMILALLSLPKGSHILEIGTGTGHFARTAAKAGHRVTAIDVSPAMLQYAKTRAQSDGLSGIEFTHAGFLTFAAAPATFDAAVSVAVLHHLPDLWKAAALRNIHRALKPGALFLLCDVVFSEEGSAHPEYFDNVIKSFPENMRKETIGHVAKEFSTLDWIMEGLLVRAGFKILQTVTAQAPLLRYLCQKQ